jgi:hypothetical protein
MIFTSSAEAVNKFPPHLKTMLSRNPEGGNVVFIGLYFPIKKDALFALHTATAPGANHHMLELCVGVGRVLNVYIQIHDPCVLGKPFLDSVFLSP